jgi:glutathione S-transferase
MDARNHMPAFALISYAALDRIEHERQRRSYLVGDVFTVADLTAAAMLSALLQPAGIQYPLQVELPPYLQD